MNEKLRYFNASEGQIISMAKVAKVNDLTPDEVDQYVANRQSDIPEIRSLSDHHLFYSVATPDHKPLIEETYSNIRFK